MFEIKKKKKKNFFVQLDMIHPNPTNSFLSG